MAAGGGRVLISGASVAGPVVAYWLSRFGFHATVVERTENFASAAAAMPWTFSVRLCRSSSGWTPCGRCRMRAPTTRSSPSSETGHRPIDVPAESMSEGVSERHVEIMRGELAKIIYEASRSDIEYVFGNSISSLEETQQGVDVTFDHGSPQTFDLVIGADGLHSTTRRLAFGAEHQFLQFLGGYLAVFSVPNYLDLHQRMLGFGAVGRTAADLPGLRQRSGAGPAAVADARRCMITIATTSQRSDG